MRSYRAYKEKPPISHHYISLEDIEKNMQELKSYSTGIKPGMRTEFIDFREAMVGERLPVQRVDQDSEKGYESSEFDKAKSEIQDLKDELLQDYLVNTPRKKIDKIYKKDNTGVKRRQQSRNLSQYKAVSGYSEQLSDAKSDFDYSGQLSFDKVTVGYPGQMVNINGDSEYNGKVQGDKTAPENDGQLQGDQISSGYIKQLTDSVSEYVGQQLADKMASEYHEPVPDNVASGYSGQLQDNAANLDSLSHFPTNKVTTKYTGKLRMKKKYVHPKTSTFFDHDNKNTEYFTKQSGSYARKEEIQASRPSSFETSRTRDKNLDMFHQLQMEMVSLGNNKDTEARNDEQILKSNEAWPRSDTPTVTSEQGSESNGLSIQENIPKLQLGLSNKFNIGESSPRRKQEGFKRNLNRNDVGITFGDKLREQYENINEVIKNRDINETQNNSSNLKSRHKSVVPFKKQNDIVKQDEKNSGSLSNSNNKNIVNIEKRRGNMAGKYRDKNKKQQQHKKSKPTPKPRPQAVVTKGTTTTEQTTTSEVIFTSTLPTQAQTNRTMHEIIDKGVDEINIPLSGSPPWHTLIHGRRDIVLAGAVIGSIGILLIILSVIYVFVNRRSSSQQKTIKKRSKRYKGPGSADEKARLTQSEHSVFPLSSDDETTEESEKEEDNKHVRKKMKKKVKH